MKQYTVVLCFIFFFLNSCSKNKENPVYLESLKIECKEAEIPREFIVKFKNGNTQIFKNISKDQLRAILEKNYHNQVSYFEPNLKLFIPEKGNFLSEKGDEPPLNNAWAMRAIHVDNVWKQNIKGESALIAIIDTQVDLEHPLLKRNLALNEGEQGFDSNGNNKALNNLDDDQNGYVDDLYGPLFFERPTPHHHGTHIAGVVSAYHESSEVSSEMIQGIAPQARIIPITFLSETAGGTTEIALKAIDYAVMRGAHVINASWGGGSCVQSLKDKILDLSKQNVLFVSASGNDGFNIDQYEDYPSSYQAPTQLVVGSIGKSLLMSDFSNYGSGKVDLFAPGTQIVSTFPQSELGVLSGTSMAAPFVTGAIALLKSAEPKATALKIKQALLHGVTVDTRYPNRTQGRLNIEKSLEYLRSH